MEKATVYSLFRLYVHLTLSVYLTHVTYEASHVGVMALVSVVSHNDTKKTPDILDGQTIWGSLMRKLLLGNASSAHEHWWST